MNDKEIIAYKGFDDNFQCRGYQYKVGETYIHNGEVEVCSSGFHACTNPFDVLSYYDITSKFAIVTLSGEIKNHEDDSKIVSAKITINAELKLPDFISSCINYLQEVCKKDTDNVSGDYSKQASSGNNSQQASSGYNSKQASSGDNSKQASSGDYSKQASSGDNSKQASSGDYSQQASSGYNSKQASSGDYSKQASSGNYCVIVNAGLDGMAKCGDSGAIALTYYSEEEKRHRISVAYVGENDIKKDTWYKLDDKGAFVEA